MEQGPLDKNLGNTSLNITGITWNMGNHSASDDVVEKFHESLTVGKTRPDMIAISTQEELAPNGKRLQDKLLARLNANAKNDDEKYVLVETEGPQYHTTTAGANNSARTLALSMTTDQNRVSNAILVQQKYAVKDSKVSIVYEPGKEKGGNKSFITIEGTLQRKKDGAALVDFSVTGCHLDSNSDKKRRAHTNAFYMQQGLSSDQPKSFDQIYDQAKVFRVLQGDLNERNYLYKPVTRGNKSAQKVRSNAHQTNYKSGGYDAQEKPKMMINRDSGKNDEISGTYGYDPNNKKFKHRKDPRDRANVAAGGILDRVMLATGLRTTTGSYGLETKPDDFTTSKKGKTFYHQSDHLPVIRAMEVTAPSNPTDQQKRAIVGRYIAERLPNYSLETKDLKSLSLCENAKALEKKIEGLLYHDSELTPMQFLQQKGIDVSKDFENIKAQLETKKNAIDDLNKQYSELKEKLKTGNVEKDKLEALFNRISLANEIRDKALEIMADKKVPLEARNEVMMHANTMVQILHQNAMSAYKGASPKEASFEEAVEKANQCVNKHMTSKHSSLNGMNEILTSGKIHQFTTERLPFAQEISKAQGDSPPKSKPITFMQQQMFEQSKKQRAEESQNQNDPPPPKSPRV